jgi:hypothetical protein
MQDENGAAIIVNQLRLATNSQTRNEAAVQLAALIQTKPTDRTALRSARAADVVADSISAFHGDVIIAQVGIGALWHVWIPPVPTERLITLVLDEMARHHDVMLLQQAGMRILRMHAASPQHLLLAPSVLTAVGRVMQARHDDTNQHWGAETVCCLASIDPAEIIRTHGTSKLAAMAQLFTELAINAPRPATLLVGGQPWYELILELYPQSPVG